MTQRQAAPLAAFKAYDIRGKVPDQLHAFMVYCIGRAYAQVIQPQGKIAVGYDIRATSLEFRDALVAGLQAEQLEVVDIGLCGTELIYFAAAQTGFGGGIMITASHNPNDYNGIKMVRAESRPISSDTGLKDIEVKTRELMASLPTPTHYQPNAQGYTVTDLSPQYIQKLLSLIDVTALKPFHVLVNAGNGCAGPFFDALAAHLPLKVTRLHHEPDGNFPNGVPNPMLEEQQRLTAQAVIDVGADFGIAWDGDFDRCFFFDEKGQFIEGYYLVALFAEHLLKKSPQSAIVHDPRLTWNTLANVERLGGQAQICKCGHSFIKDHMRAYNAVYGGEMSAHHYFRDFYYCDSGMIPWLLMLEILSDQQRPLSVVVADCMQQYPCSGEINFQVGQAAQLLQTLQHTFAADAIHTHDLDGLTMEFADWRFNLRSSNTEPVVRLNVETRANPDLLQQRVAQLRQMILAS